jgi:hypothetical protein
MVHGHQKPIYFRPRRIDVLWKVKRDLVVEEISRMREEDGISGPDFELRTAASKNLLQKMTEEELNVLNEAAKDMGKNGYSEEHRRRSV